MFQFIYRSFIVRLSFVYERQKNCKKTPDIQWNKIGRLGVPNLFFLLWA